MDQRQHWITPSAIGEFTFCEKAWDLNRCGHAAPITRQMQRGSRKHRQKGMVVSISSVLFGLALMAALIFILIWIKG